MTFESIVWFDYNGSYIILCDQSPKKVVPARHLAIESGEKIMACSVTDYVYGCCLTEQ